MITEKILVTLSLFFITSVAFSQQSERSIRYTPDGDDFVIVNGEIKFNRALYGGNTGFRVETGDLPEFAFYLPGMGGNIQFALETTQGIKHLNDFEYIESRFTPGKNTYTLKDKSLPGTELQLTALATYRNEGFIVKVSSPKLDKPATLYTIYGGATGNKFSRNGDLNADPPDVFELKPKYSTGNVYNIDKNTFEVTFGQKSRHGEKQMSGVFPNKSKLNTADADKIDDIDALITSSANTERPVLIAATEINSNTIYLYFSRKQNNETLSYKQLPELFTQTEIERLELVNRVEIRTPDPYINTLGGILANAGDAIWDGKTYQHGAVGWRVPLPGWRGAYVSDALGRHDRAQKHFSAYALSQVTEPATGPMIMDTSRHITRGQEKMGNSMFTSGYICRKPGGNFRPHHYNMNLVFIDALLWHFSWTNDTAYMREMWPLIKRHLEWEKRNFDTDNDGLYDAYAAIWASDALQYTGGAVTHSSAYDYRSNKMAARIAEIMGEDPAPYQSEADKILNAINNRLWIAEKGWWAEYQEYLPKKQIHDAAAVWSIYHAIDSDVHDPFKAYQALRYVDNHIPHIPVRAPGIEQDSLFVVSTTNWAPYSWSINNVALAEIHHTALAYWQGGRFEEAFKLWKGGIMDAMYLGSSPGNVGQISYYDAARGETYRDFADPTGMLARSTIQGLFGVKPDAINGQVLIKPGFPAEWDSAYLNTPDLSFRYSREGNTENYTVNLKTLGENALTLHIPAYKNSIESIIVNGTPVFYQTLASAISIPKLSIDCGIDNHHEIKIVWSGERYPETKKLNAVYGTKVRWELPYVIDSIRDPQSVFSDLQIEGNRINAEITGLKGHRTVFAHIKNGEFAYWLPLHIDVNEAFEVQQVNPESNKVQFSIRNNLTNNQALTIAVNNRETDISVQLNKESDIITIPDSLTLPGTNRITISDTDGIHTVYGKTVNWTIDAETDMLFDYVDLHKVYNANISDIFKNKYMSPRPQFVTLQIPWQGIGEWCHPHLTARIDEKGLMNTARKHNNTCTLPNGVSFGMQTDTTQQNILYTSLFDNYPDSISLPLDGKAKHAYLLMVGTTNHMQSRFVNGKVIVSYTDGSQSVLELINPENWCPIEQDYYDDGLAFNLKTPRPWRIQLSTGKAFRDADKELGISGVYTRQIEGGAATVLDLPLDDNKMLESLTVVSKAYEVVIGLSALTLVR